MPMIQIEVSNRFKKLTAPQQATLELLRQIDDSQRFPITEGELSVVFVDDTEIAQIHADFMQDPTPTDVITFPAEPEMDSAGEIIVSVDHAITRAQELNVSFSSELSLYIIHGWLHLAGYNDLIDTDRVKMREAEQRALALIESNKLHHSFKLEA